MRLEQGQNRVIQAWNFRLYKVCNTESNMKERHSDRSEHDVGTSGYETEGFAIRFLSQYGRYAKFSCTPW